MFFCSACSLMSVACDHSYTSAHSDTQSLLCKGFVNGCVGKPVCEGIFASRDMFNLPVVESVQEGLDFFHEVLQNRVLDSIDTLNLADKKLRVETYGDRSGSMLEGRLEPQDEGPILGNVVGAVTKEFLCGSDHLATAVHEDGSRPPCPRISTTGPVSEEG